MIRGTSGCRHPLNQHSDCPIASRSNPPTHNHDDKDKSAKTPDDKSKAASGDKGKAVDDKAKSASGDKSKSTNKETKKK